MPEMISHRLPRGNKLLGGFVCVTLLSLMMMGPISPLIVMAFLWFGWIKTALGLALFLALPFLFEVSPSKYVCRFALSAAGWFDKGVTMWLEEGLPEEVAKIKGSLWCIHPHGTALGWGFALNGAVRYKADDPARYIPHEMLTVVQDDPDRLKRMSGVMADVLFKVPLIRPLLLFFGCCTPATKKGMFSLFRSHSDFGILPGGMEEVSLYKQGEDIVYIQQRAGFIKYALQHGYGLFIGYTFGESDLYTSWTFLRNLNLILVKKFGFVLPVFWGKYWWCPFLPRDNIALNTVFAGPLQLPHVPDPSREQVEHYHKEYMRQLKGLFDRHKARFGYAHRELKMA